MFFYLLRRDASDMVWDAKQIMISRGSDKAAAGSLVMKKRKSQEVEIGPSLTGNNELHWFPLGEDGQPEALMLLQRRMDGKTFEPRPGIVLRLDGITTKKKLSEAMIQAENNFVFGTDDVGTISIDG